MHRKENHLRKSWQEMPSADKLHHQSLTDDQCIYAYIPQRSLFKWPLEAKHFPETFRLNCKSLTLALFHSVQGECLQTAVTLVWFPGANSSSSLKTHVPDTPRLFWPRWIVKRPWMPRLSLSLLMRDSAVGHTPLHMSQMMNYIAFHDSLTPRDV